MHMSPGSAVDQVKARLQKLKRSSSSTFGSLKLKKRRSADAKGLGESPSTSQKDVLVGANRRASVREYTCLEILRS